MANSTNQELCDALSEDLNKGGSKTVTKVVNDSARKTFTASMNGAVFEFPHRQPDGHYWDGYKFYGSGMRSRIRIKRTPVEAKQAG
jgi:hypothetical protein